MKREIYLDHSLGVTRAAVVEDGALCELHIERENTIKQTESLYLGQVQTIRPSVGAAFVDIGLDKNAFLPLHDGDGLRCGDLIIVQGEASQATLTKGLRVTRRVNLAGKALVLVPGGSGVRISKKIKDEALRQALTQVCEPICPPDCGLIVRTASADLSCELLEEESLQLFNLWQQIEKKAKGMAKPGLLHAPAPLALRVARDLASPQLERIICNDDGCFATLEQEQRAGRIAPDVLLERFDEARKGVLLYDALGIDKQIDKALRRRVWLPCGGYLVFDRCEAMTVIDVNSGKMTLGRDTEETAFKVNLEAADEIARQLRLRDIGGIIVVDFIDLSEGAHRDALLARMKEAARQDRSVVTVEGLTRLGLMEMTRKRRGEELRRALYSSCPHCGGDGEQPSSEEVALRALREVRRKALSGQRGPFCIRCGGACKEALLCHVNPLTVPIYALAAYAQRSERFDIEQLGDGVLPPEDAVLLG